jgi:hypothetical protein
MLSIPRRTLCGSVGGVRLLVDGDVELWLAHASVKKPSMLHCFGIGIENRTRPFPHAPRLKSMERRGSEAQGPDQAPMLQGCSGACAAQRVWDRTPKLDGCSGASQNPNGSEAQAVYPQTRAADQR